MFNRNQPIPYVQSLSETGILTIKWDREMQQITDVTSVPPAEVILRQESSQRRRSLQDDAYWISDYFGSIDGYEKVGIKKAVEVRLERSYEDDISLDWSVLESTPDQFVVQINFDIESLASDESIIANLKVTFWGTEFFKSS